MSKQDFSLWKPEYEGTKACIEKSEAVVQRYSVKKVFSEIWQDSQESISARVSFLNKVAGLMPPTLLRKRLWYRCFPVNFVNFLKHLFSQHTSGGCFWKIHDTVYQFNPFLVNILILYHHKHQKNFVFLVF